MDMLSVNKIKLHGLSDRRWTTVHKLSQYKGLISLYQRDKKIVAVDNTIFAKKEKHILANLKKKIGKSRKDLDNALYGDQQKIRNALAHDKELQLAFSHLHGEKVAEHIHQENFNRRKQLDLLKYNKGERSKTLIDFKLRVAELQDRLNYYTPEHLPDDDYLSKIKTGQLQDAILKKEGAIVVNESYKKILSVMNKDRIYFDAILRTLHADGLKQNKCMLNTIILGQLAKEYLDDRTIEFVALERRVKKDMVERKKVIAEMTEKVTDISKNLKYLVRRDVIITTTMNERTVLSSLRSDASSSVLNLHVNSGLIEDIDFVRHTLDLLKNAFYASNHDDLLTCVENQAFQAERLDGYKAKFIEDRDGLQKRVEHAKLIYHELYNHMSEATFDYISGKKYLLKQIRKVDHKMEKTKEKREKLSNLNLKILGALQRLEESCKVVRGTTSPKTKFKQRNEIEEAADSLQDRMDIKNDGLEIVGLLMPKLQTLLMMELPLDSSNWDDANMCMEELTTVTASLVDLSPRRTDESLIEDLELEELDVFSRQTIKEMSKEMVQRNSVNEDLIPMYDVPKKRRFNFKKDLK